MSSNPRTSRGGGAGGSGGGSAPGPAPKRRNPTTPAATPPPVDINLIRRKLQLLAWIRYALGALAGLIAGIFPFNAQVGVVFNANSYLDAYIAVVIYIASYYLAKNLMNIGLPVKDKNKLITQGIGGFVMMFFFFWILYSTLCYTGHCVSFPIVI